MDIAGLEMWSSKMHIGLGTLFILFLICFVAIFVEETFLGGRRRRRATRLARERNNTLTQRQED